MKRSRTWVVPVMLLAFVGCQPKSPPAPVASTEGELREEYLLSSEPSGAQSVIASKQSVKDGDLITLVGRIGGSASPFVSGRAVFTVVDTSLVPCSERDDDACPTPWDYCCDLPTLPGATAMVKLVDGEGNTVQVDPKSNLGLHELETVVVQGTAKRDEAGNLTVLAPAIYIKGRSKS